MAMNTTTQQLDLFSDRSTAQRSSMTGDSLPLGPADQSPRPVAAPGQSMVPAVATTAGTLETGFGLTSTGAGIVTGARGSSAISEVAPNRNGRWLRESTSVHLDELLLRNAPSEALGDVSSGVRGDEGGGITDAGEELHANRRNRGKVGMQWQDIETANDALKVKEVVKAKVWPKPDYAQLIEAGMQPLVAHMVKQVYDSIAAQPSINAGVPTKDAHLKTYMAGLHRVELTLMRWADDPVELREWAQRNTRVAGALGGDTITSAALGPKTSLLASLYPDGWRNHRSELGIIGGNRVLGALQPGYDEIERALKAIDKGWPESRESWEVQGFKVLERPEQHVGGGFNGKFSLTAGQYFVAVFPTREEALVAAGEMKPFILVGKRGFVGSFESLDSAVEAARARARAAKNGSDGLVGAKGAKVADADRVGPVHRLEGEDISSDRLMEEFGFRGVNFGNWMKTRAARAEAQLHLNHAFDALHDLANLLDVPPKVLSLGGMLGLAFGAQGHGGRHAGHFVPGVNEMNLTRETGAGVLAHEWAHALDHSFARQAGLETAEAPFLSEHVELGATMTRHELVDGKYLPVTAPRFGTVRPEIVAAFKGVVMSMTRRRQSNEEARSNGAAVLKRIETNVDGWLASIRKDFKDLEPHFDALAHRARTGDLGVGKVAIGRGTFVSPVVVEMRDLYKAKHGHVYQISALKGLQSNLESLAFQKQSAGHQEAIAGNAPVVGGLRSVSTDYARNAALLDEKKGGKRYWSTRREMFARAFDSFVADRLACEGAKNSYLSFGVRATDDVPVGSERQVINAAFDSLIGEFMVRDAELGPALFSVGPSGRESMEPQDIHVEIERLRGQWKNMPPVRVVATTSELPFESPQHADGAYHDGKVYVVAENIANGKQLQKVMAHECVMHHSLEEMLGNYGFAKLHYGIQTLKASGDSTVCALADDVRARYGELPADIETREIVARAGEQCLDEQGNVRVHFGFMKGVFAGVSSWLRDHGVSMPFTNTELQGILHNSGQWAKGSRSLKAQAVLQVPVKLAGLFIGKILGIENGLVEQRIGRVGETVWHSMADLSAPVQVGEVAEIAYLDGKGIVKGRAPTRASDFGR